MKEYPAEITVDMLPKWAHLRDEEIERDIRETQVAIDGYRATMQAEEITARSHPIESERRMADFKAGARPGQIAEREAFNAFLRRILAARHSLAEAPR